jgi:predicted O-methyltransferase YrrM
VSAINPVYAARRVLYQAYRRRHPDEPWLAQKAIGFLDDALPRDGRGLEWGSGRSTSWFGARLAHLTSIEFDAHWYATVSEMTAGMSNVDLRLIALEHDHSKGTVPYYDPLPRYVSIALEFDDDSLDFVLVDGGYRQACVLAAIPKLKRGGLLVIDNTDWLPRAEWHVPSRWPLVHESSNVMTTTSIWRSAGPRSD